MHTILCYVLATLLSGVLADVEFTEPAPGASISATTITMSWKDSGISPPISELASYQIFLCAGGDEATNFIPLTVLVSAGYFSAGNTAQGGFSAALGADVENAYFLKMVSAAIGGMVINYSGRFTLQSMDGAFPAAVTDGLKTINGTAGPPTENDISAPSGSATQTVASTTTKSHASTISLSSTSSISLPTSTPAPAAQGTSLGAGAGAGIAVGGIILLLACAFGIYYCIIRSRRRAVLRAEFTEKPQLEDTSIFAILRRHKTAKFGIHELPADSQRHELAPDERTVRYELDGKAGPQRQISTKELPT